MIPVAGIQSAFADEPVERPVTTGDDAALEGYASEAAPVAQTREDGMYVADGLVYTVADGGLSLVGFDGLAEGEDSLKEIVVPEAVSVDGEDASVVSVAIAEGNVAEGVVALTLPQSVTNVNTATLASAFPDLASVEVATPKASAPVAAGAAAMKAAYSSFGGVLYKNNLVASESDASQTTLTKELVWAPPATVVARIPAECRSIAAGAFADVKDLKTVVCFGVMEDIPQAQKAGDGTVAPGAFTDEQIATVDVIVPQTGTVVTDGDRVSADVAVTDDSTMDIKREAWWKAGFASDRITLGEVYGSTTNTLPVTEEGTLEAAEAEVAYAPETTQNSSSRKAGIEPPESAIPTPVPDDDQTDPSESGLVFTHLADMTLSVRWKGDPTATPAHIDIPAYVTIDGVAYPVTEIAPNAFEGAVFLESVTIPEGVTAIGDSAFAGCGNLSETALPFTLKEMSDVASVGVTVLDGNETNHPIPPHPSEQNEAFMPMLDASSDIEESGASTRHDKSIPNQSDYVSAYANDVTTFYISDGHNRITSLNAPSTCVASASPWRGLWTVTCSSSVARAELWSNGTDWYVSFWNADGGWIADWNLKNISFSGNYVLDTAFGCSVADDGSTSMNGQYTNAVPGKSSYIFITTRLATPIVASSISDGAITTAKLAANAVTSAKIADGTIVATDLANGSVTTDKLGANAVTSAKIADGTVASADLANNAVTSAKIQDGAVAVADLAANAVETAKIKDGAVTSAKIADGTVATADLANNSVTDDKLAVKFGTISYSGLDGAHASVYPTSYRQGGTPALPVPKKAGCEFLGWTWPGQDAPTTDANVIKGAFAGSGAVTMTANWKAASTGYFFSTEAPFDKDGGEQSFTLAVRLSDAAGTLGSASFENDNDALFPDGAGVAFAIGNALGADGALSSAQMTASGFSAASGSPVQLAQLGEQSWGVYVKVTVSGDAAGEVTKSFSDGSYVAKFVKLNYELS